VFWHQDFFPKSFPGHFILYLLLFTLFGDECMNGDSVLSANPCGYFGCYETPY
jgi:hypothetical protein